MTPQQDSLFAPSGPADDAEYLRRVYLDVIGTLPTPDEAHRVTYLVDDSEAAGWPAWPPSAAG